MMTPPSCIKREPDMLLQLLMYDLRVLTPQDTQNETFRTQLRERLRLIIEAQAHMSPCVAKRGI